MNHEIRLHEIPFNQVKDGSKTIESRLYDEKRKQFRVGDLIKIYKRSDAPEFLTTEIVNLHVYKSFEELFNIFPVSAFGGKDIQDLTESIYKYYSKEDEEKHGVVGIEFKVVLN